MTKNKSKYLVARYVLRPKRPSVTVQKGWQNNPGNLSWDEQVGFFDKVKDKDLANWQVILDLTNQRVIKSQSPSNYDGSLFTDRDYSKLFDHFKEHYGDQINKFLDA